MRRILFAGSVAALVLVVAGGLSAVGSAGLTGPMRFTVVERPLSDAVTDTGPAGDSAGDLLTFANKLYDDTNTDVVGKDQGSCIRIDPAKGKWQCSYTSFLEGGQITVEGAFYDTRDSLFAVTGGTGQYRNVRGTQALKVRSDGNFDFVFKLIP
jgi:allene oxide cyclase